MTITVYENNRKDSPIEVSEEDVVEAIAEGDSYRSMAELMPYNAVNTVLAQEFGSFDPNSDEYQKFEEAAGAKVIEEL